MKEFASNQPSASRLLVGGLLILVASSMAFNRLAQAKEDSGTRAEAKPTPARLLVDENPLKRDGKLTTSFSPIVKKVAPSVVNVFTSTRARNVMAPGGPGPEDPFFRRFFGDEFGGGRHSQRTPRQNGLGSGVVVTKDGYILTNNHVVENADEIKVAFTDGREFVAKVVGRDPKSDVAVLKIEASDLPFLSLANSDALEVGDLVLAIGNPFGVGQTVTMGMVSAMGRATLGLDYEDFIQTDAAINPGNSGGALVDTDGRLIGINTAILSRSGGSQGIGFAIPVNLAKNVMESLIRDGRVARGFLGVNIQDLTPALAKEFNLKDGVGALVAEVTPKSPAEKAGLQSGDVVVEFAGKPVRDSRHLKLQVAQVAPGSKVSVKILRDGSAKTLSVTLKEFPGAELSAKGHGDKAPEADALEGVTVGDIDPRLQSQLKLPASTKGAVVTQIEENSSAFAAGLREGDVILEINRAPVKDAGHAVELSEKIKDGKTLLRVWSKGGSHFLVVDESKAG